MDKKWKYLLHNNKALQFLSKYLIILIREMNEKEILGDILKKNMGYDEILIEESSKDIIDINSTKKNQNRKVKSTKFKRGMSSLFEVKEKEDQNETRKVELIYFCLLKFKGLIRYMNFQGLKHGDIRKISYFIRHISFKRGEYIFRQGDKSDALYGVITGKVIIRFVKTIDTFKKLNYENILEEDLQNNLDEIPIDYFMSDCEEGSSDDDYEESENENENEILFKNKRKKKLTYKPKKKFSILDSPDESESEKKTREKVAALRFKKVANETEEQIDRDIDRKIMWERKRQIDFTIKYKKPNKLKNKKEKKKQKVKKIEISSERKYQTPKEEIEGEVLFNFIKEFEYDNFIISNGMCFGEWGLVYSIPRTTSIYCIEDCDLFYLEKEYFNRILSLKFAKSDSNKINFLLRTFPFFRTVKIGHILTKIVPLFFEYETLVYTPFDKAENLYVVYQGECTLVTLDNATCKEDYLMKKSRFKIISRLNEGGIAGFESCSDNLSYYNNALLISKEFTTLLKVNIKVISEKFKDFKQSVYPLYEEQKKIYDKIKNRGEKIKNYFNLKRLVDNNKNNYENLVKDAMTVEKKRTFSNNVKFKNYLLAAEEMIKLKNNENFWHNNLDYLKTIKSKKLRLKEENSRIKLLQKIPKLPLSMIKNKQKENKKEEVSSNIFITSNNSISKVQRPFSSINENSTEFNTILFSKSKRNKDDFDFSQIQNIKSFQKKKKHHRNINSDLTFSKKKKKIIPFLTDRNFYHSGKFNLPFLTEVN